MKIIITKNIIYQKKTINNLIQSLPTECFKKNKTLTKAKPLNMRKKK